MAKISRLETPRESRRTLRPSYDPETFGRLSERFARFIGTAKFLVYMSVLVLAWVVTSQEDRARDERNLAVTEFMVREIAGMRKDLIKEFKEILDERLGTDSKPDTK